MVYYSEAIESSKGTSYWNTFMLKYSL